MTRFKGRPWMAAAFTAFVIAALVLVVAPVISFLAIPLGLAFMTLDMTRPAPPSPDD
jgi:hypothetical protein